MLWRVETRCQDIQGQGHGKWQRWRPSLPVRGRRQSRERTREGRAAVAKEYVRASGGGRGRAQVKGHEDQHDDADADEDGGDGDGASRVLRAQPALVRAAVPALIAARAEDTVVAVLARGVAVLYAAQA